ncbi:MAG: hypothetical protein HY841_11810 [Bacteroidetes bacterium]|nr:hypothetical protein [Bacteroidota bacterium]
MLNPTARQIHASWTYTQVAGLILIGDPTSRSVDHSAVAGQFSKRPHSVDKYAGYKYMLRGLIRRYRTTTQYKLLHKFFVAIEPLHGLHIAVLVNVQIKPTAFTLRTAKSKPNSQS